VTNTQEKIDIIGNNNVIYNQIVRLKQAHAKGHQPAPHLIIIAAGTNDAWFTKHRPQAYDKTARQVFSDSQTFTTKRNVNTVLTLAESVRYGCEMLMESFPGAQLVLVTPPQCVKVDGDKLILESNGVTYVCTRVTAANAKDPSTGDMARSETWILLLAAAAACAVLTGHAFAKRRR
jgi:hypothetical protein